MKPHSVVDLITNSSSTVFCIAPRLSIESKEEIIICPDCGENDDACYCFHCPNCGKPKENKE